MDSITYTGEFLPEEQWLGPQGMVPGFGDPSLPASADLVGRTVEVVFEDGKVIRHEFHSQNELTWTVLNAKEEAKSGTQTYRAVEVRPQIFFVDFLKGDNLKTRDVSIVIDFSDGDVTVAETRFVNRNGEVRTHTDLRAGRIDGMGDVAPRPRSEGLVGKRVYYRYSPTDAYEHLYLNPETFLWHCVKGG